MSRNLLAQNQLQAFKEFLESQGWVEDKKEAPWQVLRMQHPDRTHMLIVYEQIGKTVHYTVHGESERMARKFILSRRGQHADL